MADEGKKEGDGEKRQGRFAKIIAAVFAAVVAPILVAAGIKWTDRIVDSGHPAQTAASQDTAPAPATSKAPPEATGRQLDHDLITPNLAEHFYSCRWSKEARTAVRDDKVDPKAFEYVEELPGGIKRPSIHVSGSTEHGFLGTKNEYENYSLFIDWKWGGKTYGDREDKARWAAVLLHITGPDGQMGGPMPEAVVVHFREKQVGNIRLFGSEDRIQCKARVKKTPDDPHPVYDREAPEMPLKSTGVRPRDTNGGWDGIIYRRDFVPESFEDKPTPADKLPAGWNKVQIDCDRGRVTVYVNNKVVNEITDCNQTKGRIAFATQGAEWYIGRIKLVVKPSEPSPK